MLDLLALILFFAALAYNWLGNVAHEIVGMALFVLLLSHNAFNRRWYGDVVKRRGDIRKLAMKIITLRLLMAMLVLMVTSVIISRSVFNALAIDSTPTARQIHASLAYVALLAVGGHIGLHWQMLHALAERALGQNVSGAGVRATLRLLACGIAAYRAYSFHVVDVGTKLFMRMTFLFWDFEDAAFEFFVHQWPSWGCARRSATTLRRAY